MPDTRRRRSRVDIASRVMGRNDTFAERNRERFRERGILALNLISSPGAGKTSLLEAMAGHFGPRLAVIEGDVMTRRDAERVERAGCRAYQIETGGACHLDAESVGKAMEHLDLDTEGLSILAIENVGNLICPSGYDLGEDIKIGLLSTPEGDDKVLKYPSLFSRIAVLVINKIDLLPMLDFDVERAILECRSLNPEVIVFRVSARSGEGLEGFFQFLEEAASASRCTEPRL